MDDDSPALDDARPFAEKASSPTSAEAPQGREPPAPHGEGGALVSATIKDSIATAFQALTASVALTSGETVDRHVRDLLRPMLRTWLDDNLPVIVEKLVRVEIERVARGGR